VPKASRDVCFSAQCRHRKSFALITSSPRDSSTCASASGTRGASNPERTAVASRHHRDARADDRHASVERLSVPVITAIASACLVNRDTLADIKPSFENDTNIIPMPPE
jgi:hypothetical protein